MDKILQLQQIIDESNNIVFFGGAGVSTESGLKDFRSVDGIYHMKYDYPPEVILSHDFFFSKTKEFFKFYRDKMLLDDSIQPNPCHLKLVELEKAGKLKAIVTQNIDNLHFDAGSKNVIELHGSIARNYCVDCYKKYPGYKFIKEDYDIPRCSCGGIIKPDVVLYEESLDRKAIEDTIYYISHCDTLIIGGCSLTVYPAASFIEYFKGKNLVVINKQELGINSRANLVIKEPIGKVFSQIKI